MSFLNCTPFWTSLVSSYTKSSHAWFLLINLLRIVGLLIEIERQLNFLIETHFSKMLRIDLIGMCTSWFGMLLVWCDLDVCIIPSPLKKFWPRNYTICIKRNKLAFIRFWEFRNLPRVWIITCVRVAVHG